MEEAFRIIIGSTLLVVLLILVGPPLFGMYVFQARLNWLKATVAMLNTMEEANKNGKESKG